jgi:hypothetical protein
MECQYCKGILKTKWILLNHQKTAKYCLKLQNQVSTRTKTYICNLCQTSLSTKQRLVSHINTCKANNPHVHTLIKRYEDENNLLKTEIIELKAQLRIYKELSEHSRDTFEDIARQRNLFENEAVIEIEPESDTEESDNEEKEYELAPLDLGKGYEIEHREEDGYINVSNLGSFSADADSRHLINSNKTRQSIR